MIEDFSAVRMSRVSRGFTDLVVLWLPTRGCVVQSSAWRVTCDQQCEDKREVNREEKETK